MPSRRLLAVLIPLLLITACDSDSVEKATAPTPREAAG